MPSCRNCGGRITRFDKDICPICGQKNPLEGVSSETVEFTNDLNSLKAEELKTFRPATKFKTLVLFCLLGWTGAPMFYLGYISQALIYLAINLFFIGGIGSVFAFLTPLGYIWGYVLAFGISFIINIVVGIIVFLKHNLKDGRGEFLR